jgi:recombinational DNA repair ATPase RecF
MRIDSLHLQSFRGFEALDLDFNPSFTLLLGENGAGKTAVLEALSVALGALFLGLLGTSVRPLTRDDVRHKLYEHAGLLDLQRSGRRSSPPRARSPARPSPGRAP